VSLRAGARKGIGVFVQKTSDERNVASLFVVVADVSGEHGIQAGNCGCVGHGR
jgi:hypothetical protein